MNHPAIRLTNRNSGWIFPVAVIACGTAAFTFLMSAVTGLPGGWLGMWGLALLVFALCKMATLSGLRKPVSASRLVRYLLTWPGMDAATFLDACRVPNPPTRCEWTEWTLCAGLGLTLLLVAPSFLWPIAPDLAGWSAVCGLVLSLHFGIFGWLSGIHRLLGIDAVPIMDHPSRSASLAEFWGRRWNLAFRDLSHRFLFRPLAPRLGAGPAAFLVFLVSGLIHDLVISLPAGGGYGGPTLYFLAQWLGLTLERNRWFRACVSGNLGRLWTAAVVLLPLPLLAHEPFRLNVILPMLIDWRLLP